jgi:N-methylhydantoinase B
VRRDLAGGYISPEAAKTVYGLSAQDIAQVQKAVKNGETLP